jgi:hypothetical protein
MNKFLCTLFLTPLVFFGVTRQPAHAQSGAGYVRALYDDLRTAVCANDWDDALAILSPMIAASEITERYRAELIEFRQRVQDWRATQAEFLDQPNCPPASPAADPATVVNPTPQDSTPIRVIQPTDTSQTARDPLSASPSTRPQDLNQCTALGNVMNWAGSQSQTLLNEANFSNIDSLIGMLTRLADVSEQAATSLQTLQLGDRQLRTYQQNFIAVYEQFDLATNGFVNSVNASELDDMEHHNAQLQDLAQQEFSLINQVNSYCGSEVIAVQ